MKMLLPILLILLGLAGGLGAGHMLKPPAEEEHGGEAAAHCDPAKDAHCEAAEGVDYAKPEPVEPIDPEKVFDYVKLNKQFVVPVLKNEKVSALIVLSVTIEAEPGFSDSVYQQEPKLRDLLLQVLFEHAHSGGFDGVFTADYVMADLRGSMLETMQRQLGPAVHDVLITDIVRRDL